jgi:HEAT repeat protein
MKRHCLAFPIGSILTLFCLLVVLTGCNPGSHRGSAARMSFPPQPPPPVPKAQQTPIDPAMQQQAHAELNAALQSSAPDIRAHAIEAMQDALGEQAAPEILKALDDSSPLVRFSACIAAGELRLKDAHDTLARLANDPDPSVRISAKFALHRIGDTSRSHDLEKTAKDLQPVIRAQTAMVLGLLEEPSAVKLLKPMLVDPAATVRLQAAESLWRLGNQEGLDALIAASISKYSDDQMVAILALAQPHDRRVLGHVEGALTNPDQMVCLVAARAAGMLGSDEGYGVALQGAKSADPRHRMLAALAFGAIGRTDAQPFLATLLKDSNQDVRIAAATALLELKPQ